MIRRILPWLAAAPLAACAPAAAPVSTPSAMPADTPRAELALIETQPSLGTPNPYRLPPSSSPIVPRGERERFA